MHKGRNKATRHEKKKRLYIKRESVAGFSRSPYVYIHIAHRRRTPNRTPRGGSGFGIGSSVWHSEQQKPGSTLKTVRVADRFVFQQLIKFTPMPGAIPLLLSLWFFFRMSLSPHSLYPTRFRYLSLQFFDVYIVHASRHGINSSIHAYNIDTHHLYSGFFFHFCCVIFYVLLVVENAKRFLNGIMQLYRAKSEL